METSLPSHQSFLQSKLYFKAASKKAVRRTTTKQKKEAHSYMSIWECLNHEFHQFLLISQCLFNFLSKLKMKTSYEKVNIYKNTILFEKSSIQCLGICRAERFPISYKFSERHISFPLCGKHCFLSNQRNCILRKS